MVIYHMGNEKIEQNIERVYKDLYDYLFYTPGLDPRHPDDAIKILDGVINKIKASSKT